MKRKTKTRSALIFFTSPACEKKNSFKKMPADLKITHFILKYSIKDKKILNMKKILLVVRIVQYCDV